MPELPEVEQVRRSLQPSLLGQRIGAVTIHRASVVRHVPAGTRLSECLLEGGRIRQVLRRGKQLALIAEDGRCLHVHLGMTGSLRFNASQIQAPPPDVHTHVVWPLPHGELRFRDPRRFGGLWPGRLLPDDPPAGLSPDWGNLGEDALSIQPATLHRQLQTTRRPLKTALLDQKRLAGLGNIYVDELLFVCRLAPQMPASALERSDCQRMVQAMRRLLERALAAGGSTLRDYVDGDGKSGGFQHQHQVYGRAGLPCRHCGQTLIRSVLDGRGTVTCATCQPTGPVGISTTSRRDREPISARSGDSVPGAMSSIRKRNK